MEGESERERERLTNTGLNVFLILHVWTGRCDFLMSVYEVFELSQRITIARKKVGFMVADVVWGDTTIVIVMLQEN